MVLSERQKAVNKLNLVERSEAQELRLTTGLFFSLSNSQKQYYATICAVHLDCTKTYINNIFMV